MGGRLPADLRELWAPGHGARGARVACCVGAGAALAGPQGLGVAAAAARVWVGVM